MQRNLRRYIVTETAIGALVTATINVAVTGLSLSGAAGTVFHAADLAASLVPQTFMAGLMSALVPLLLTRSRQVHGRLPFRLGKPPAIGRAVMLAVLLATGTALLFVPVVWAALPHLMGSGWSLPTVLLFNALAGALLAALVTPAALTVECGSGSIGPSRA